MILGYARLDGGEDPRPSLWESGCVRIFTDTGGARPNEGRSLIAALLSLEAGDMLLVPSLASLTFDYRQQVRIIDHLEDVGAFLRCADPRVCTDTPEGKFILSVAGALTDHEYKDEARGALDAWWQLLDGEKAAERALLAAVAKEKKDTRKVRDQLDRLLRAQRERYRSDRESAIRGPGAEVEASENRIDEMQAERTAMRGGDQIWQNTVGSPSDPSREPQLDRAMPADAVPGSTIPEDTDAEVLLADGTWLLCQVIGQRKDRHGRWCVGIRWYASSAVGGREGWYLLDAAKIRRLPD